MSAIAPSHRKKDAMKRRILSVLTVLALSVGLVSATAPSASAVDVGVNMNQVCQLSQGAGYVAKLENANSAYGWRCWVPPWGVRKSAYVQRYCDHFGLGLAIALDADNPYSWRCRS